MDLTIIQKRLQDSNKQDSCEGNRALTTYSQLKKPKYWEYNKDLYNLFINFAKAYDGIQRTKMKKYKISEKLARLTKMYMTKQRAKVDNVYSERFLIYTGVDKEMPCLVY